MQGADGFTSGIMFVLNQAWNLLAIEIPISDYVSVSFFQISAFIIVLGIIVRNLMVTERGSGKASNYSGYFKKQKRGKP